MSDGFYKTQDCLVIPIQSEFYDVDLERLQSSVLQHLEKSGDLLGVVLDLSSIEIIDGFIFQALLNLAKMTKCMGCETVFTGFRPSVVSALVGLSIDIGGINSFSDLEKALHYFHPKVLEDYKENEDPNDIQDENTVGKTESPMGDEDGE